MAGKDLYAALGVQRGASLDEIKKSYRKLARKYHPDVNPGDARAEERFKEISAAFDVLGDPEKRKLYDEFGQEGLQSGFDPEKARAYREWQERARATSSFRPGAGGFGDLFGGGAGFDLGDLFGDAAPFLRARERPGTDVKTEMTVSFREAVLGTEREIAFVRPSVCETCNGSGLDPAAQAGEAENCPACGGSGRRSIARGPLSFNASCEVCRGTGNKAGPACKACGGIGLADRTVQLKVKVPAGVEDGQSIRLSGQGIPGTGGASPGDLFIRVRVQPHPHLRREGRDLVLEVPITVREAMLGAKIDVPTLEGYIKLTVPAGSQTGSRLRVKAKGVRASGKRAAGDLHVILRVQVPDAASDPDAARRSADELERLYGRDVRAGLKL